MPLPERSAIISIFLLTAVLVMPCRAEIQTHCSWKDPVSEKTISFIFKKGTPALITPARNNIKIFITDKHGSRLPIVRLSQSRNLFAEGRSFDLVSPAEGVQFASPAIPGDTEVNVFYKVGDEVKSQQIICIIPYQASWNRSSPWVLEVKDFALGIYPESKKSRLEKIRKYPAQYIPKRLYARITEKNIDCLLSSSLRVSDMVIPTEKTGKRHTFFFPVNYFFLQETDNMLAMLKRNKLPAGALKVLSLFRTPEYNSRIGSAKFSQHIYANGFDFFFDADNDGMQDDLNGDGKVNLQDAAIIIDTIEEAQHKGALAPGGLGFYYFAKGVNKHRLTFHLDFRGFRAFWAYYHRKNGKVEEIDWKSKYYPRKRESRIKKREQ
ncbi:MAG: hypothetical protein ACYTFY_07635 [Planctomycetota bacterium]|jgi:hypothetical protein